MTDNKGDYGLNAQKAIEIRRNNPCATLQSIGDKLGISRERVRQILTRESLPTTHYKKKYLCINCGNILPRTNKLFCNKKCYSEYHTTLVECTQCGKLFSRNIGALLVNSRHSKNTNYFCSKECQGKFIGTHYGFKDGHPYYSKKSIL